MTGTVRCGVFAVVMGLLGCGPRDGLSDYERMKLAEQSASNKVTASGAKVKEMTYPQGKAWSVDLSGLTISDELLKQVKQMGKVSELNLSRSTVSDAQLGLINELKLCVYTLKLDLSHTAVTDAGFEKLETLGLLSDLNLIGTKVTPAAVDRFRQKRQADRNIPALFKNPRIRLK